MLTLDEIEVATEKLPPEQQFELIARVTRRLRQITPANGSATQSTGTRHILDIPPVSAGVMLVPYPSPDDDILEEMLEERL